MMRGLLSLLPKGRLWRAIAVLVTGTALGQLIVLAASPLVTRLYTPADFGVLGVFSAFLGILGIAVTLRYELAIPLAEDDASVVNLVALSLAVTFLLSLMVGVALWPWGEVITGWFNAEALRPLLWLLPVGLVAIGWASVFTYWAVHRQAFGHITRNQINRSVGQVATQVSCGYLILAPLACWPARSSPSRPASPR